MKVSIGDNDITFALSVSVGMNEYSFCTSTLLSNSLLDKISRNGFRIKDPVSFILEITKTLSRVGQVLHGNCLYLDRRILMKTMPGLSIESLKSDKGGISFDKVSSVSNNVQGYDIFFLKEQSIKINVNIEYCGKQIVKSKKELL